jgi:hypothetical protein
MGLEDSLLRDEVDLPSAEGETDLQEGPRQDVTVDLAEPLQVPESSRSNGVFMRNIDHASFLHRKALGVNEKGLGPRGRYWLGWCSGH